MPPLTTVPFQLTPTLLAQINHTTATHGMIRPDWMQNALLEQLRDEQRYEDLRTMERQLLIRLNDIASENSQPYHR